MQGAASSPAGPVIETMRGAARRCSLPNGGEAGDGGDRYRWRAFRCPRLSVFVDVADGAKT